MKKIILDACCGSRMFWYNKHHPNALYIDNRVLKKGFVDNRFNREIMPDIKADFRNMPFKDNSFKLVIWDPPHIIQKPNPKCRMTQTYGCLNKETWKDDLRKGFNECWRVLDKHGVLIFKWSDCDKWANSKCTHKEVLALFHTPPLIGQKVKWTKENQYATFWFCFMKYDNLTNNQLKGGDNK